MQLIPFLGHSFMNVLPALIAVLCLTMVFNVWGRLLRLLRLPNFQFKVDLQNDEVEEGQLILRRELRKLERRRENSEADSEEGQAGGRGFISGVKVQLSKLGSSKKKTSNTALLGSSSSSTLYTEP